MSKVTIYPGTGSPIIAKKQDRNSLCQCGSGKKSKRCCGTDVKYYSSGRIIATQRNKMILQMDQEDRKKRIILSAM